MNRQPLCRLSPDRKAHTPTEVFNWVAQAVGLVNQTLAERDPRLHDAGLITRAKLTIEAPDLLVLSLLNDAGIVDVIRFIRGKALLLDTTTVRVPDIADALHISSLLIAALDAKLVSVSGASWERNANLFDHLPSADGDWAPLALANHERQAHSPGSSNERVFDVDEDLEVSGTSVEMFNWSARMVREMRACKCDLVGGVRLFPFRAGGVECLSLAFSDSSGIRRCHEFISGTAHDFEMYVLNVPDLAHALHMVGIVLTALGIDEIELGDQLAELNPDLIESPLLWGGFGMGSGISGPRAIANHERHRKLLAVADTVHEGSHAS